MPKYPIKFNIKPPKGSRSSSYATRSPIVRPETLVKGTSGAKKGKIAKLVYIGFNSNFLEEQSTGTLRQGGEYDKENIAQG